MTQLSIHINGKEVTRDDIYCFEYRGKIIFIGTEDYWEIGKKGRRGNVFIGNDWYEGKDIENCRKIGFEEFDRLSKQKEQDEKGIYYTDYTIAGKYKEHVVRKFTKMKKVKKVETPVETYFGYWDEDGKIVRIREDQVYKCNKLSSAEIEEIKNR